MIKLDQLLDNDHLTSSEQREVRRFIDYYLDPFGNGLIFAYCLKCSDPKPYYYKIIADSLDDLKTKYPELLHTVIANNSKKYLYRNSLAMERAADLLNNDPLKGKKTVEGRIIGFNNNGIVRLPVHSEVTVKTLWQIFKLISIEIDKDKKGTGNN